MSVTLWATKRIRKGIWLLLFGSLPTQEQLDDFCELLAEHRALPDGFMDTMNAPSPNIMNKMQRCVLGLYSYDEHAEDLTLENILNQSINLIASMPTMMVNWSTQTTAAATAPPSPPVCCPPRAPIPTRPLQPPLAR